MTFRTILNNTLINPSTKWYFLFFRNFGIPKDYPRMYVPLKIFVFTYCTVRIVFRLNISMMIEILKSFFHDDTIGIFNAVSSCGR